MLSFIGRFYLDRGSTKDNMWKLMIFGISILSQLVHCSVSIKSTNLSCEILLTGGCYEDFELIVPKFHDCISLKSNNEFKLTLKNYSMPAFPNGSFSYLGHIHSFKLRIEEKSELQLLFPNLPGFSLFTNSWFDSVVFYVSDLAEMIGWRWTALFDLRISSYGGFDFTAIRSKLLYLHSDFGKVADGKVIAVRILKCQLRWLGKNVFAPLKFLKTLELRDNLLESIERSHLPTNAPQLKTLDLGNNKLTSLPLGLVDGLNLESIYLRGNNIKITETQAQTILRARSFPTLLGVLWPCSCEKLLMFTGKSEFQEQNCYKDDDLINIYSYQKMCSERLNIN